MILESSHSAFLVGDSVQDYIKISGEEIRQLTDTITHGNNPIKYNFDVLYSGSYFPRTSEIYNLFGGIFLCLVNDRETNIINYSSLSSVSENILLISQDGIVLHCEYPEKTVNGDPVGMNLFDILKRQDIEKVKNIMAMSKKKNMEIPVEYSFVIDGEIRHKIGTIKPQGSSLLFRVKRIAGS